MILDKIRLNVTNTENIIDSFDIIFNEIKSNCESKLAKYVDIEIHILQSQIKNLSIQHKISKYREDARWKLISDSCEKIAMKQAVKGKENTAAIAMTLLCLCFYAKNGEDGTRHIESEIASLRASVAKTELIH